MYLEEFQGMIYFKNSALNQEKYQKWKNWVGISFGGMRLHCIIQPQDYTTKAVKEI